MTETRTKRNKHLPTASHSRSSKENAYDVESKDIKSSTVDQDKESSMEIVTTVANLAIASQNAEKRNKTKKMDRNRQIQTQKK